MISRQFWLAWTRWLLRIRLSPPSVLSVGEMFVSNGSGSTSVSVSSSTSPGLIDATVCGVEMPRAMLRIRPLPDCHSTRAYFFGGAARSAVFEEDEEPRQIRPPQWLVNAIHQRGQWPTTIRLLTGIIRCPTLRPDGTVIQSPGFDPRTGLLFAPDGQYPPIPADPPRDDAIRAAAELLDVVCDFPFAGPPHRSVWLALLVSWLFSAAMRGACPLFVIDANAPGSGKSLLSDAAGFIAYGHDLARKQWPGDDNEVRQDGYCDGERSRCPLGQYCYHVGLQ